MTERSNPQCDAAGTDDAGLGRRLVAFVHDAARYAGSGADHAARRLLQAPYSGVPRADAGALLVAAGARSTLLDAIAAERIPLPHQDLLATRRFARALGELTATYRAQGARAAELTAAVELAFELRRDASAAETRTLDAIEASARELDAACTRQGRNWDAAQLCATLAGLAQAAPPATAALPPLVALGPYAPEPGRNVVRPERHFSASALTLYAQCARRWFYRYVCVAVEDKGSSASVYGSAFHWALECFHQEHRRADAAPREVLQRDLDAWIATAFDRYRNRFETTVEYELQRRRARRTGIVYLDWFVERARRHPFSVIGTETAIEMQLGKYDFRGYIDRLDRDDASGAITVVDYKTGVIVESAAEYREKVAQHLEFQLPLYYWARSAAGDRVSRLALVPIGDTLRPVQPIELEVVPLAAPPAGYGPSGTIGIDELERARAEMIELARVLSEQPIDHFPAASDPQACRFCEFVNACRERPMPREDRFAR